jgi:hypothetical protein
VANIVDDDYMQLIGWRAVGNTWYPPEDSHDRQYDAPLMYWCRVDGTLRISGSEWTSKTDVTIGKFREVCAALGVTVPDVPTKQGG